MNVEKKMREIAVELNEVASRMSKETATAKPFNRKGDHVVAVRRNYGQTMDKAGGQKFIAYILEKPNKNNEYKEWGTEVSLDKMLKGSDLWFAIWDGDEREWLLEEPLK